MVFSQYCCTLAEANDCFAVDLDHTIHALDSITIDRHLRDLNVLDTLLPEPGACYIMDRACLDFQRLHVLSLTPAFFVIRARPSLRFRRLSSQPIDKTTGLRCDQTGVLTGFCEPGVTPTSFVHQVPRPEDPQPLGVPDQLLLTPRIDPHRTVPQPMAGRTVLQVDQAAPAHHSLFRHLGNAVKPQVRIAVFMYVRVAAIPRKRLHSNASLCTILQILSVTLCEKIPLSQLLASCERTIDATLSSNRSGLFE